MNLNLIPNSLSLGNLFLGFLSIVLSAIASASVVGEQNYHYVAGAFFIMGAGVLDALDGRIARKINHPNPIGKELDSLADLVTFGLAPGFMFYFMMFGDNPYYDSPISQYKYLGAVLAFLFPLFGALRLAKFNTLDYQDFFIGIPSPIAGISCVLILVFDKVPVSLDAVHPYFLLHLKPLPWWGATAIFVFFAVLMKSTFVFPKLSPSFMNFSKGNSIGRNLLSAFGLIALILFFKFFLILSALIYILKAILTHKRKPIPS